MAELIVVVGLAASIVQLIDASTKVYERVKEYKEGTVLGDATKQVDLLRETLKRLQTAQTDGFIHATSERAISGVVEGSLTIIKDLDRVISRMTPADGSSKHQRVFKGIQSFGRDRRVKGILVKLDRFSMQLASFFAVDASVSLRETARLSSRINATQVQKIDNATFFEVPALHVSHFVGREDLLSEIHAGFNGSARNDHTPVTVLLGMGGQGVCTRKPHTADIVLLMLILLWKTQIALKYCNRFRAAYRGIFWIDASSKSTTLRSFEAVAKKLGVPETATSPDFKVDFVISALGGWTKPWMLVFDNYDDPTSFKDIKAYFPTGCGRILCTSRHADVGRLGTKLDVGSLSEVEGLDLLLHRSHHERTDDNVKEGTSIVQKLGCLALAIDQAAAYINFRHLPLMHFMDHYERRKKVILNHTPESLWEYRRSLGDAEDQSYQTSLSTFTTWEMSFQQIAQDDNERRNIGHFITLAAFLNPAKISEDLFEVYFAEASPKPEWIQVFCSNGDWDSDIYQDTICGLFNLSLIQNMEYTGTQTTFSLHPLVRHWLQLRRDPEDQQRSSTEVLELLAAFVDIVHRTEFLTHSACMEVSSHIGFWLESEEAVSQSHSTEPPEGWRGEYPVIPISILTLGSFLLWSSLEHMHELAERLVLRNLSGCAKYLGQTHPLTMDALGQLGGVYEYQDRYMEAKAMYDKVSKFGEGIDDRYYRAKIIANSAGLSSVQGDHDTAAQRWLLVFETQLMTLGDCSSATIEAAIDAGGAYYKAQDFVTAAILMEATALVLKSFGNQYLNPLPYADLGEYYLSRNKLEESKKWFSLGLQYDHMNFYIIESLGQVYIKLGRYVEAEDYLQEGKQGCVLFHGPHSVEAIEAAQTLGLFYWGIGKLEAAVNCLKQAGEGYSQVSGTSDDPGAHNKLFELNDLSSSIIDQPGWDPLQYEYTPLQIRLLKWAGRVLNHEPSTGDGVGSESVNDEPGVAEAMDELRISNTTNGPQEIHGLEATEASNGQQPYGTEALSDYLLTAFRLLPPVPRGPSEERDAQQVVEGGAGGSVEDEEDGNNAAEEAVEDKKEEVEEEKDKDDEAAEAAEDEEEVWREQRRREKQPEKC